MTLSNKETDVTANCKIAIRVLFDMYKINSKTGHEHRLSRFVQQQLESIGINDYEVTKSGAIHRILQDKPLLSAHLDQVGTKKVHTLTSSKGFVVTGNANLGADDKNGVWIALRSLERNPDGWSFIFSTGEEAGGAELYSLAPYLELEEKVPWGLVLDRRGSGDIIGAYNTYCCDEFENDLMAIGQEFGFTPELGAWSDADILAEYMSVANLSCGYYKAHTDKEYTNMKDVFNTLKYIDAIYKKMPRLKYELPDYYDKWANDLGTLNSGNRNTQDSGSTANDPKYCPYCGWDSMVNYNDGMDPKNISYCYRCNIQMVVYKQVEVINGIDDEYPTEGADWE